MKEKFQLELRLLLKTGLECPSCTEKLVDRLAENKGVEKVHLKREESEIFLCLHYDPDLASLAKLSRLAEDTGLELSERYYHETLHVTGMDCTDCAVSVEYIIGRFEGMIDVSVNYAAEKMKVEYDSTHLSHEDIVQQVKAMGYGIEEPVYESWFQENWELALALLSGFFLAASFFVGQGSIFRNEAIALYALAYLASGFNATRHAFKAAIHARFDIDFLMVVAALGAALVGRWAEGALLLFLFSLGHSLEHYAMDRARHAIEALGKIAPKTVKVRRKGG